MIFICPIVLIIPLNPLKWPAYFFGSAFESEMPDLEDKFTTPIDNLQVTAEYLDSPQSDIQWRDRMWKVLQDTSTINAIAELGHDPGSFIAGALANKMAEKYMNEMVDTALTLNEQEELYLQIFKQIAIENRSNHVKVIRHLTLKKKKK